MFKLATPNLSLSLQNSTLRNLPCSTAKVLTVEVNRISVALNFSGVTQTIALDVLNNF